MGLLAVKAKGWITWWLYSDTYIQTLQLKAQTARTAPVEKKWRCKICRFLTRENFQNFLSRTFQTFALCTIPPKKAMHQRKKAILWYLIQGGSEKCWTNTTMNTCPTSNELRNNYTLNNSFVTSAKYNSILWPKQNSTNEGNPIDLRNRTNRVNLLQWTRWGLSHGTFHFLSVHFWTAGAFFSFKKPAKLGSLGRNFLRCRKKMNPWDFIFQRTPTKIWGSSEAGGRKGGGGEVVDTNGTPPYVYV